jgi:hypothetical protein
VRINGDLHPDLTRLAEWFELHELERLARMLRDLLA